MDGGAKARRTIDAPLGQGASRRLPRGVGPERLEKNGRARAVWHAGEVPRTLRTDGGTAPTSSLALLPIKSRAFAGSCVEVGDGAAPFVERGRSVFCEPVARRGMALRGLTEQGKQAPEA